MSNQNLTAGEVTCVDMSNSSILSARVRRTLPLRVNGEAMRCAALDFGDAALAGEWGDTTSRCRKLPSCLCGDGEASAATAVTNGT